MNVEAPTLRQEDQFRELLGVLRRRKAIIIALIVLFAGLGAYSASTAAPLYQVHASVLLQDYFGGPSQPATDPVTRVSQVGSPLEIGAQIGLMSSPQVLNDAFEQAGVPAGVPVAINRNDGPLLDIVVTSGDGDQASRVAQAVPDAYNRYVAREAAARTRVATAAQRVRLAAAKKDLDAAQRALEVELYRQGDTPVTASRGEEAERTSRLNGAQANLDSARVALATAQEELAASMAARSKIPERVQDISVRPLVDQQQAIQNQLDAEAAQLQSLRTVFTDRYPDIVALKAKMDKERQTMRALKNKFLDASGTTTRNPEWVGFNSRVIEGQIKVKTAQTQVAKYEALVAREKAGIDDFQKRIPIQRKLEQTVGEKQAAVQSAAGAVGQLESLASTGRLPVLKLATSTPSKVGPAPARTVISFTFLGVLFGIMVALLRDRFDNRIYTIEQIYDVSGAVPIGQVPSSARALAQSAGGQSRSRVLESYRSLRFNLESTAAAGVAQSVLIASATAGEGRAGLSLNLATEAATDSRRTILIDGDLRTPELHELLKVPRSPGLSDVLSGSVSLDDALVKTGQENLFFLPSGSEQSNPLELLVGPSFASLHEALKERADVIVFNSPSLMRYTDARAIANVADSVLFVAKRGFTRRDAMRYCIGMLRRAHARLLGVVLSDDGSRADVPYYGTE